MNEMTTPTDLAQALHTLLGACAFLTIQSDGRGYFESGQNVNRFRQAIADGWKALDSAAHERAQPASVGNEWQPIETCPHDGSQFLIWVWAETHNEDDDGNIVVTDCSCVDVGWWVGRNKSRNYGYVDFGMQNTHDVDEPTYWMPLPAAPQPAKDTGK